MANNFVKTITVNGETYDIRPTVKKYTYHSSGYIIPFGDEYWADAIDPKVIVEEFESGITIKFDYFFEPSAQRFEQLQDMIGYKVSRDGAYTSYYMPAMSPFAEESSEEPVIKLVKFGDSYDENYSEDEGQ